MFIHLCSGLFILLQQKVLFYDPVLTDEEKKIMTKFGMVPIETNEVHQKNEIDEMNTFL